MKKIRKIKASSLLYAVFFLLFVSLIISALLLVLSLNSKLLIKGEKQNIEKNICQSAITSIDLDLGQNSFNKDSLLYVLAESDSIWLQQQNWGLLQYKKARTESTSTSGLFGNHSHYKPSFAISLLSKQSLSLEENVSIAGDIWNSKPSIKKKKNSCHITGNIFPEKKSSFEPTQYNLSFEKLCSGILKSDFQQLEFLPSEDSVINSFYRPTLIYESKNDITLGEDSFLEGNIIILSKQKITIKEGFSCKSIIIAAPSIIIEEGFYGSLQAFYSDSLLIEKDCHLLYPSFICALDIKQDKSYSVIKENSIIEGGIVGLFSKNRAALIGENIEITGQVLWPGWVNISGQINGQIACNNFYLSSSTGLEPGQLKNLEITNKETFQSLNGITFDKTQKFIYPLVWLEKYNHQP